MSIDKNGAGECGTNLQAAAFRDSLARIVKPDCIVADRAVLDQYSSDGSFAPPGDALLLVYPETRAELQEIVRTARNSRMPLVPVSSGPPRFHGGTVPAQGAVMVNFSRMNHILNIDPVNRAVRVEAGVSYAHLIPELKKRGLKLNIPLLPRASKSVVASRLEREPALIPKYQFDYMDPLLTLEVVYGTGDDFRTGSASGPGALETLTADMVNPWGPGMIDYSRFLSGAQGTMGFVTWAATKVEVLPSLQKTYFIPIRDVGRLAAPMIGLLRQRVVDECLALNNVNLATMLAESWPSDFEELRKNLPSWTVIVCIAGYRRRPDERVAIQERYLKEICAELRLEPQATLPGAEGNESAVLRLLSGPWEKEPYWKLRRRGSCHEIFFLTTLSKADEFIRLMREIAAEHHYPADEMGSYVQPMVQGRGCHCEFSLPCDSTNPGETAKVRKLFTTASEALMKRGAFFSRPYGPWADMVYSRFDGTSALKRLKGIFDPGNILNPGKLCF